MQLFNTIDTKEFCGCDKEEYKFARQRQGGGFREEEILKIASLKH